MDILLSFHPYMTKECQELFPIKKQVIALWCMRKCEN
jgi:hypothetical protein